MFAKLDESPALSILGIKETKKLQIGGRMFANNVNQYAPSTNTVRKGIMALSAL